MQWFVLTGFALVVLVVCVAVVRTSTRPEVRLYGFGGIAAVLVGWVGLTALLSFHTVENGHIGIVKQFGSIVGTTGEGLVNTAPWQNLTQVSVRNELRTYTMDNRQSDGQGSAVSRDSQPVFLVVQVNYSLLRAGAVELYKQTGGEYVDRILDPAVFQITKEVTAQYKAIDFAANREKIRQEIEAGLQDEVEKVGAPDSIKINNVSLKNVDFTEALSAAIEQTVEAEQQAKREQAKVQIAEAQARQKVAVAEGEARSNIVRAQGEAKANKLRQQSLTPLLLQQQAIETLNPNVQIIVCPPRTVCIPNTGVVPIETGK